MSEEVKARAPLAPVNTLDSIRKHNLHVTPAASGQTSDHYALKTSEYSDLARTLCPVMCKYLPDRARLEPKSTGNAYSTF